MKVKVKRCYMWSGSDIEKNLKLKILRKDKNRKSFVNSCSAVIRPAICSSAYADIYLRKRLEIFKLNKTFKQQEKYSEVSCN